MAWRVGVFFCGDSCAGGGKETAAGEGCTWHGDWDKLSHMNTTFALLTSLLLLAVSLAAQVGGIGIAPGDVAAICLDAMISGAMGIDAAGEPAEIVGTATSRAQLQRIAWRAERRGDIPDYAKHIAGDIARDTRRYHHLVTITGWADAAGVDVSAVNSYLDEAAGQLKTAEGRGTVEQRHDAVHIARAWMLQAHTTLMPD